MASREKSIAQLMVQRQRKKCLRPGCFWIGTTDRQFCPVCDTTLVSAAGGPLNGCKYRTVMTISSMGDVVVDNRDEFPSKLKFD